MIEGREITNGFLNRFLLFWAERQRIVPFPKPTPDAEVSKWAGELRGAVAWLRKRGQYRIVRVEMDDRARDLYAMTYTQEWSAPADHETVAALLERAPTIALRLGMTLALLERSVVITEDHLRCAIAWTRYQRATVEYVWRDRVKLTAEAGIATKAQEHGQRILAYLRQRGQPALRTDIVNDCFGRHISAKELDAALEHLQLQTPPAICVASVPKRGRPSQTAERIGLMEDQREHREGGEPEATTRPSHIRTPREPGETDSDADEPPEPRSPYSRACESDAGRATTPHSRHSPHSRGREIISCDDDIGEDIV
jgi:hypothetical protein